MNFLTGSSAMILVSLAALALSSPVLAGASPTARWTGVVTHVVDGDTVRVQPPEGGKPVSIRIDGIDAPEICQAGGMATRDALQRRILGKRVVIQGKVQDDYGRTVGTVFLKGQDQGQWLVTQGLAWSYRYRNNAGPYAVQQGRAQAARLGLFARQHGAAPVYPADFRKKHASCYAKYR